jgi:subtilase family protein
MNFHQLEVRIRNRRTRRAVTGDEARADLVWNGQPTSLVYDPAAEAFVGDELEPGLYRLRVTKSPTDVVEHEVRVDPAPTKVTLWTGPPLLPAGTPDGAAGHAHLLGVLPHPTVASSAEALARLTESAVTLGLQPVRGWTPGEGRGPRRRFAVFSLPPPAGPENPDLAGDVVAKLLADETVAAAGPFVGEPASAGALLSQQIYLRLAPGASLRDAEEIAAKQGLTKVERLPVGEDLFIATLAPERAFEIAEILTRLGSEPQVRHVEPVPVAEIETDCCGDYCGALWDRCLIGAEDAQALLGEGTRSPLLALVDIDWLPAGVLQSHPELRKAEGSPKERVVASVRFEPAAAVNSESHALMCAGIAAGGVSGVAPQSRMLLFKDPYDDWAHARAWLWAGGASCSNAPDAGLPVLPGGGADLFCASIGRPEGVTDAGIGALRRLVVAGRHGRGCPLFFSAGNLPVNIVQDRGYASLPFTLAIAASTYSSSEGERFASYSSWGDVDLCAPSGTEKLVNNAGGRFDGVLAPEIPHCGTYPYRGIVETKTTAEVASDGSTADPAVVPVASAADFVRGGYAMLVAGDGLWASREVYDADSGQLLLQPGTLGPFPASSRVVSASRRLGRLAAAVTPPSVCLELESPPKSSLTPGQRIRVGTPGVSAVRDYTVRAVSGPRITVCEELSAYPACDEVFLDESHWNLCWGTSTAAPLCAGTAALMLAANPRLSWVEVRHLLHETAVKIDAGCEDEIGQWLGRDGQHYKDQPFFSRRYGFGRLDAREAVCRAIEYDFPRDLMIRQFEEDEGSPREHPFGDSPDIWVRAHDPRSLAAEQRNDPRWHEPVIRSRDSWIFARVRNRGRAECLEAWVRFYVAAGQEKPYRFPEDFELNRAEVLEPGIWSRGTQFVGEVAIAGIPPGGTQVVAVRWDPGHIPPAVDSEGRPWDPYILVAISPLDGPEDGVTMLDCNNLAQRTIQIQDQNS